MRLSTRKSNYPEVYSLLRITMQIAFVATESIAYCRITTFAREHSFHLSCLVVNSTAATDCYCSRHSQVLAFVVVDRTDFLDFLRTFPYLHSCHAAQRQRDCCSLGSHCNSIQPDRTTQAFVES